MLRNQNIFRFNLYRKYYYIFINSLYILNDKRTVSNLTEKMLRIYFNLIFI